MDYLCSQPFYVAKISSFQEQYDTEKILDSQDAQKQNIKMVKLDNKNKT